MRRGFMPSRDFDRPRQAGRSQVPATRWYPSVTAARLQDPALQGTGTYWLTLPGSLTRALQLRCRHGFHVEVLAEGFRVPSPEERLTLGLGPRQRAWIREVQLCGDGQPWVRARTVIPAATLEGRGRRLRHLGRKPLGAYLFSRPEWRRGSFQAGVCRRAPGSGEPRLARRSRFSCGHQHLLVGEYFLPALMAQG